MPDQATVTLDPSEVQDAAVPTLDASEVVDQAPAAAKPAATDDSMTTAPPSWAQGPKIPQPNMQRESVTRAVVGPELLSPEEKAQQAPRVAKALGATPGGQILAHPGALADDVTGGAHVFKQGLDLLGPENFADNSDAGMRQTAAGFNSIIKGTMSMSQPVLEATIAANPEAIWPILKGMFAGTITGAAAEKITKAAGAAPEYQDLAKTAGFFIPTAAGFLSSTAKVGFGEGEASVTDIGGTKGANGQVTPGSGRVSAFRGSNPQEFTAGVRVGGRTMGVRIPRAPQAPDPVVESQQADTQAAVKALADDSAAGQAAKRAAAGIPPPPPPKPPMPSGMDQGELRPAVVSNLAKMVQIAPPSMRAGMFLEAHANLAGWLQDKGTVILPDGKLQIVDSPKKAQDVARDILNDEVERHQQAHQDNLDNQQKAKEDQAKQVEEQQKALEEKGEDGEDNPLVARAKTILAANQDAPPARQVALLQRQLRVGPGMAAQILTEARRSQVAAGAGNVVGSSTEPVTEEPKEQIDQQVASLAGGSIPVVFLPEGTKYRPAVPEGMKMMRVSGDAPGAGAYLYNPAKIQAAAIREAAQNGTHGDLLGHIQGKDDVAAMKVPAIVQAKTANGKPIQESVVDAADPQMIRDQAQALRERHPGAHVQVRHPETTLKERDHAIARESTGGGDIFDHIAQERGKEKTNAVQKQGSTGVHEQPGGQGEGRGEGREGVQRRQQGTEESAREGAGTEEVRTRPEATEGGRGESPERSDRRRDTAQRRRIAEMTPEEMRRELLTSDKTGLPNRRAFEDAQAEKPAKAIAMSDADGLKALNDSLGYEAGDQLLRAKADALREAGIDSYHDKGDEFIHRGENNHDLRKNLDRAREILRDRVLEVTMKDGSVRRFKGADFSFGTGESTDVAERGLKEHKAEREASGERRRGELRGIREVGQEADRRGKAPAKEESKYELGTTQHTLEPGSEAHAAIEKMQDAIPADALAGQGKDVDEPHVTLRYGIKGQATEELRQYLRSQRPFTAKLGKTGSFPPTSFSDGAAVLMAPVESADLHRMNAEIEKHAKFGESSFPEYKPHVTVAYMKPDRVAEFTGRSETAGKTFHVDSIDISDKDGKKETVKLEGAGQGAIARGDAGVIFKDDKGVERAGTVVHTNERMTRLKGDDGQKYEVRTNQVRSAAAPPEPGAIGSLHSSQIHLAPKDFQYKASNIGESGTSDLLHGRPFNDELAGIVSVWRDPADGKVYVVNGHHRTELAQRTGGKMLAVRHLRAENRQEARAIGALQNIAEGRGTAIDAAKFMRDSGLTLEDLEKKGISMGEATAQNGVALARLDQTIFDQVATGKLSERKGVAIGRATDNPATQEAIVKMIAKAEARGRAVSDATVQELARFAASAGEREQTVESLFGDRQETQNLALEKAEVSAFIQRQLRQEKNIFGAVASESRAKTLSRTGNKINAEKNAAESRSAAQALEVYDRLSARRGPVDDALNAAAGDIADGKPANTAKQRAYDAIRAEVHEALGGGKGKSTRRSVESAERPSDAAAEEEAQGLTHQELEDAGQGGMAFTPLFTREHGPLTPPRDPSDPFYLKSARVVDAKMRGPMKGADLVKMLENAGVKADEIQWTGLGELAGEDKVTLDQVREVLAQDRAKLTEVVKGGGADPKEISAASIARLQATNAFTDRGLVYGIPESTLREMMTAARADEPFHPLTGPDLTPEHVDDLRRDYDQMRHRMIEHADLLRSEATGTTKYSSYQLPGGANYREMLLTLPATGRTAQSPAAEIVELPDGRFEARVEGDNVGRYATRAEAEAQAQLFHGDNATTKKLTKSADFQSGHWNEPNILTHIRYNDRTDADGKKLLHIEEIQSDWHQKGRSQGYRDDAAQEKAEAALTVAHDKMREVAGTHHAARLDLDKHQAAGTLNSPEGKAAWAEWEKQQETFRVARDAQYDADDLVAKAKKGNVPDAPFKKTWHELALRRMLHHAAENGYDGLSWTPGEKQAERYDLSKQVSGLRYRQNDDGTFDVLADMLDAGHSEPLGNQISAAKLPDYVGKEVAQKMVAGEGSSSSNGRKKLSGVDLKVGGEGMRGFYDKIVPDYLNKLGKQWGAKVGDADLGGVKYKAAKAEDWQGRPAWHVVDNQGNVLPEDTIYTGPEYAVQAAEQRNRNYPGGNGKVPMLPITDAMRQSVLGEGQPMFSPARLDATPEQQARAQRLTTSDPKFPYLDRAGIAKLYQQNLRRVIVEPETPTLPGMDEHIDEHTKSAEQVSAEALQQRGVKDITKATREIEQHSPLFGDNEDVQGQGALFARPKYPQQGAGQRPMQFNPLKPDQDHITVGGFVERSAAQKMNYNIGAYQAKESSLDYNLKRAEVVIHPPKDGSPTILEINPNAYAVIYKALNGAVALPGDFGGVFVDPASVDKLGMAIRYQQQEAKLSTAVTPFWEKMMGGRTPRGGMVIVRGDLYAAGAREECAHSWFEEHVAGSRARTIVTDAFFNSDLVRRAIKILEGQGYQLNKMTPELMLNEVISKALADAGGQNMPLGSDDISTLLAQFLDLYSAENAPETTRKALESLPQVSTNAREAIDAWKARNPQRSGNALRTSEAGEVADTRSLGPSIPRGPPEGARPGFLFTPAAEGDAAESRGRDQVESLPGRVRAYVQGQADRVAESRDLAESIATLGTQYDADVVRMTQAWRSLPGTAKDEEQIYHHLEDPGVKLSQKQEQIYSEHLAPIEYEAERIKQKLDPTGMLVDNYVRRIAKEKGSLVERVMKNIGSRITGKGNVLRKSAGALKRRTMMAIQHDVTGDRQVVSIKNGRVTQWKNNETRDRGDLRSGMTTRLEEMDPHLERVAQEIIDNERELKDLPRNDRQAAADRVQKQIDDLETTLKTVAGRKADKSQAGQIPGNLKREISTLEARKRTILATPLETYQMSKRGIERMGNLKEKRTVFLNQRDRLLEKMPVESMQDKLWKDKNGLTWRITQATTKEIEQHSPVRYYHNAAASIFSNYLELRKAERAHDFLEVYKSSPEFARIAVHPATQQAAGHGVDIPEGWKTTALPNFAGYYFEPHTAEVLDKYAKQLQAEGPSVWSKVNDFLRTAIFFNPLMHVPNLLNHWVVERGVTGLNPAGYARTARATVRAINAVVHQNQDFLDALDAGGALQSQRFETQQFADVMVKKMLEELETNESTAKKVASLLGYADPRKLIQAIYKLSGRITWYSNDLLFLQSAYEKVERGIPLAAALRETGKHIPTYRLPARIFNSKALGNLMSNPALTMFGAYHYGALASYGQMLKSVAGANWEEAGQNEAGEPVNEAGRTRGQERAHAIDILAALGLVTFAALPALDEVAKKLTGNKRAEVRRSGASTFVYNLVKLAEGEETPVELAESVVTPAVGTKAAAELAFNRDFRTGHNLYDPHAKKKELGRQLGQYAATQIGPLNQMQRVQQGRADVHKTLLQMVGIGFPLHGPERRAMEINAANISALPKGSEDQRKGIMRSRALHDAWDGDFRALNKLDASDDFSEKEKRAIWKESMEQPLVAQTKHMNYSDVLKVYHAHGATAEEHELLHEVLDKKLARLVATGKEIPEDEDADVR